MQEINQNRTIEINCDFLQTVGFDGQVRQVNIVCQAVDDID